MLQVEVQINRMSFSPTNVEPFSWETFNEDISSIEDGPLMSYGGLLEQLNITRDTTDYLDFSSVKVDSNESFLRGGRLPTLVAGSTGHGMHVFINGKLTGESSNLLPQLLCFCVCLSAELILIRQYLSSTQDRASGTMTAVNLSSREEFSCKLE